MENRIMNTKQTKKALAKRAENYFQFPLRLLRMPGGWNNISDAIVGFGCAYAATNHPLITRDELPPWEAAIEIMENELPNGGWDEECAKIWQGEFILKIAALNNPEAHFVDARNHFHGAARLLRETLAFLGYPKALWSGSNETQVRLRVNILLRRADQPLSEREARILIAIYSSIGSSDKQRIPLETMSARMWGYDSMNMLEEDGSFDATKLLSDSQLRTTIKNLERLGFFARFTIDHRSTYYSIRMTQNELKRELDKAQAKRTKHVTPRPRKPQREKRNLIPISELFPYPGNALVPQEGSSSGESSIAIVSS